MIRFLRYSCFMFSIAVFLIGSLFSFFNLILVGVLLLWLHNILYSFENLNKRILFLIFNCTFFVFLLSRPAISMFRGNVWWYFEPEAVFFSLNATFLSLISLFCGAAFFEKMDNRRANNPPALTKTDEKRKLYLNYLKYISLAFYLLTMAFFLYMEFDKLIFMRGKEYADYYLEYQTSANVIVRTLGSMPLYALCLFLAAKPSKKEAFLPLAIYVLSAVPSLLIGIRTNIVLNCIFVFLYYFIRDIMGDKKKWLGKGEKGIILIILPFMLLFLGAYNYIREDSQIATSGIADTIIDLFYKQGVSYDVLCMGYAAIPNLPDVVPKNYTFGPFLDYFLHGNLSQALFGTTGLGTGNNEIKAIYGNSFAHSMSYVAKPDYLQGHGWGSSYILELFADFGFVGLILFNIVLGILFIYAIKALKQSYWRFFLVLIMAGNVMYIPRAEATGWLLFLTTPQFWCAVIFCCLLAKLCVKSYKSSNSQLCKT